MYGQASADVGITAAITELFELLAALEVPAAADRVIPTVPALHSHIVAAAEDISKQAAKAALVLKMKDIGQEGRTFACKAVAESTAQLGTPAVMMAYIVCVYSVEYIVVTARY